MICLRSLLRCNSVRTLRAISSVSTANACIPGKESILHRNSVDQKTFQVNWASVRHYAKTRDKKKEAKGKKPVPMLTDAQLAEIINVDKFHKEQQRLVSNLKEDFLKHLTLRTSLGALDTLKIIFEEKEYELQELAEIVRKNPKTIIVNLSIFPQAIPEVLKSLDKSGLGLNPQQDGTTLYIPVPKVTKEHREQLAKNAKALFIKCRDAIKDVQNKFIKAATKEEGVSEDMLFKAKQQITFLSDQYVAEAETILKTKQSELLGEEK